jgi:hypothetical protein
MQLTELGCSWVALRTQPSRCLPTSVPKEETDPVHYTRQSSKIQYYYVTYITHNESIISYVKVTCQSSCSLELVLPAAFFSSDKTVKHTVSRAVTRSALERAPHTLPWSSG